MAKRAESGEHEAGSAHPLLKTKQDDEREKSLEKEQDSLAVRLKAGDRTAAAELVDLYYEKIYLFMRRLGHDRQAAEDLTQESFLNAWHHVRQLKDDKALNGWLYRIAANVSRLFWRKHKGAHVRLIDNLDVPEAAEVESDKAALREQIALLRNAVAALPLKLRQVIVLHYMQHLTIAEAAEAAGVRQGTFKSRLNRALKVLREQMS